MRKKFPIWLGAAAFFLLCILTMTFFHPFTAEDPITYVEWAETPAEMKLSETERFSAQLDGLTPDSYLLIPCMGAEMTVYFDGEEIYSCKTASSYGGNNFGAMNAQIFFPPGAVSGLLELDFTCLNAEDVFWPPLARITSDRETQRSAMGYANLTGIPAGAFAVIFLLLCALFLLGIYFGQCDFTLIVLALATAIQTFYPLAVSSGYYFLPDRVTEALTRPEFALLTPLLLLLYLFLNRKRGTLRLLGQAALGTLPVLAIALLVSRQQQGYLWRFLVLSIQGLFSSGYYDGLLHWLTVWMIASCALISAVCLCRDLFRTAADRRALMLKNELILKNNEELSEKNRRTAVLRHEWLHQLSALKLLLSSGQTESLSQKLDELTHEAVSAAPREYSRNATVNALLGNASDRAETLGVAFHVQARLPETLSIDFCDLTALLLNMLDNAFEAAAACEKGSVDLTLNCAQGFLVIHCTNTFHGTLLTDEKGRLQTTKKDLNLHGLGLKQMESVAKKYHGILEISHDEQSFSVRTALKLWEDA